MLTVSSLSIQFGGHFLFDDVSFMVAPQDRIGLVGKNGAGKSTLLKILAGLYEGETGAVHLSSSATVGYLPQEGVVQSGRTVYDETATAFADVLALERKIRELSDELERRQDAGADDYQRKVEELAEANERFARAEGWSMRGQIERVLGGLGFEARDFTKITDELSGGWQMRIELAKILLRKPDLILLDEPTNHLDIESLTWLENFLANYRGAIIMVSHDRSFLDAVTNRTLEISLGKIHDYPAAYSRYEEMRRERRELQEAAFKNQQKQIAETERFIERFRYKATKATQVQSRIKQLDKLERIEIEEEDTARVRFRFPPAPRSGAVVFEARNIVKRFGDKIVLNGVDFILERGEKAAFVGKNGEGKTTFSKILIGAEAPSEGAVKIGHNVGVGYYAQHQAEMLDPNATALDIIDRAATGEMRTKIRDLLGAFLFSGDAVYKKVKTLSGGEKSRLALAKLLLEPVNVLALDEPTNHLDMRSKDVLKQALADYDGAVIIVSHDRDFLQGLTSKVVEFRGGTLKEYSGDIYEFLRQKNIDSLRQLEQPNAANDLSREGRLDKRPLEDAQTTDAGGGQLDREERKRIQREERRLARQIEECEAAIANLEGEVAAHEAALLEPDFYSAPNLKEILAVHAATRERLDAKVEEWSALSAERETLLSTNVFTKEV